MVVHYLYDNGLIPKLSTYFDLKKDKNLPAEDAIQKSFGVSAGEFDKALRNYISSGRYKYYPMPTPANIISNQYAVQPLVRRTAVLCWPISISIPAITRRKPSRNSRRS